MTNASTLRAHRPVPNPVPPSPAMRFAQSVLPPVVLGVALLALYAWVRSGLPEHRIFLMPSGVDLWDKAFSRPEVLAELAQRALVTLSIAAAGLACSIPIGVLLGMLMFRLVMMERAIFPYLVALQSIPILAIIPLIQAALGFGFLPKVLIVAMFFSSAAPVHPIITIAVAVSK